VPPVRFLITPRVDHLCSLLVNETKQGARLCPLYFESLATAMVVAVVSQTDSRPPDAGITPTYKTSRFRKASPTSKPISALNWLFDKSPRPLR
jgi:hypothetical protein